MTSHDADSSELGKDAFEGVAIIGMAGRFPGASTPLALWKNVRAGVESIRRFSVDELLAAGESPQQIADPAYVPVNGFLTGIDEFDAAFFGMSPRDAAVFDPQHRLFLECAWEAFEDAGYVGADIEGSVGVFAAAGGPEYLMNNVSRNRQIMATVGAWLVRHTGNDQNFLATRVSYELDLNGPSLNVQTACSSALSAVHLACQSLLARECDVALAGGSTVYPAQTRGYLYKQGEILSPDGHCRTFDARAAGTVMSSALGCVVLKRFADALIDGDTVLAVIRGSAMNNDGADKVGYLAPSVSGQTRAIREALAVAGVVADDVTYIEAHGTGTLIGDPIELTALCEAFRGGTSRTQYCAIGSLKSNIGHAGEAAGIAGLIKTVFALSRRELPPSMHFEQPNPQIDFESSPFFVNATLRPWVVSPNKKRIAGVTALGAGGTNVHVVVEEGPPAEAPALGREQQLLVLSARTTTALDEATSRLAAYLRAQPDLSLADTAFTLLAGRKAFPHRRAVVAASVEDAVAALESPDRRRLITQHHALARPPAVFFLFPGGGAQYVGMGTGLYRAEAVYRAAFDRALSYVEPTLRADLRRLICDADAPSSDATARLEAPSRALPALVATEFAVTELLASWGVAPTAMIGHSAGEYTAALVAGVLSVRDAMALVALRGRLFETLAAGAMLSVQSSAAALQGLLSPTLSIAAINAPELTVLSGSVAAIESVERELRALEIDCARVRIDVAAHSHMLEPILEEFERFCRTISFGPPNIPFVSNVTGNWITEDEATSPSYWVQHLRSTVRFAEGAGVLLSSGAGVCVEVGPGRTLSSLMRSQPTKPVMVTPTLRHPEEAASDLAFVLAAIGRLFTAGLPLDATKMFSGQRRRRVPLPTYPFERQKFWVHPDASDDNYSSDAALRKQPDISQWFRVPTWVRSPAPDDTRLPACTWLVMRDPGSVCDKIAAELRRRGHHVVEVFEGASFAVRSANSFDVIPSQQGHFVAIAEKLRQRHLSPRRVLNLWPLRARARRVFARRDGVGRDATTYRSDLARHFFGLLGTVRAFSGAGAPLALYCVARELYQVHADDRVRPEIALVEGMCRVAPNEFPEISCVTLDIGGAPFGIDAQRLSRLISELEAEPTNDQIALRGRDRWLRRFAPATLLPATEQRWFRVDGVYLITGGLGGIGLAVAERLARLGPVRLALIGRTAVPDESEGSAAPGSIWAGRIAAIARLRALGAEVMTIAADVADADAMANVLARIKARFGRVHGVFHAAGVLQDELIALRESVPKSAVLDVKVKGTWVLDALFRNEPLDLFVLFSSVSAILGLPGQLDYTAANAFLDAFATARRARAPGLTLSINWNAWQDVGMLAVQAQSAEPKSPEMAPKSAAAPLHTHPVVGRRVIDADGVIRARVRLSPSADWVLGEHLLRGGDAVIPGTGFLEFVRAAFVGDSSRPVEISDVVFLAPFVVRAEESRELSLRIDPRSGEFSFHAESAGDALVVGQVRNLEPTAAHRLDLMAARARCTTVGPCRDGRLVQSFMAFGPRWSCVESIALGAGEALVTLQLADAFVADLERYELHPALLDMATGATQMIVPGFDAALCFNVPFSYGRVLLRRPLTARVHSHVRLRTDGRDPATFDIAIYDDAGDELVQIERFVMRPAAGALSVRVAQTPPMSVAARAALQVGMTPAEGLDALDRMLAVDFTPQIIACTVPFDAWLARIAAARTAGAGGEARIDGGGDAALFERPMLNTQFEAPRDPIERELAAQWCTLLGIVEVGIHDDFFELGGQSLLAVRLFQRLSKQYGVELPLSSLFQAPTIAQCAALLRGRLGIAEPDGQAVTQDQLTPSENAVAQMTHRFAVPVQIGAGGAPLFIVHGAGGNVLNFRDLAKSMDPSQTVYGLQAAGTDGVSPLHASVEEMAQAYLAEIRTIDRTGPYYLAGYSGGGVVAYEMAQRLLAAGCEVGLLAFFDTFHPQMPLRVANLQSRLARLRRERATYIRVALERQVSKWRYSREQRAIAAHIAAGETVPMALRELYLSSAFATTVRRYRPRPWSGRILLFKAAQIDDFFMLGGPSYGWEHDAVGGVEVFSLDANHDNVVLGANGRIIASEIAARIRGNRAT